MSAGRGPWPCILQWSEPTIPSRGDNPVLASPSHNRATRAPIDQPSPTTCSRSLLHSVENTSIQLAATSGNPMVERSVVRSDTSFDLNASAVGELRDDPAELQTVCEPEDRQDPDGGIRHVEFPPSEAPTCSPPIQSTAGHAMPAGSSGLFVDVVVGALGPGKTRGVTATSRRHCQRAFTPRWGSIPVARTGRRPLRPVCRNHLAFEVEPSRQLKYSKELSRIKGKKFHFN